MQIDFTISLSESKFLYFLHCGCLKEKGSWWPIVGQSTRGAEEQFSFCFGGSFHFFCLINITSNYLCAENLRVCKVFYFTWNHFWSPESGELYVNDKTHEHENYFHTAPLCYVFDLSSTRNGFLSRNRFHEKKTTLTLLSLSRKNSDQLE